MLEPSCGKVAFFSFAIGVRECRSKQGSESSLSLYLCPEEREANTSLYRRAAIVQTSFHRSAQPTRWHEALRVLSGQDKLSFAIQSILFFSQ